MSDHARPSTVGGNFRLPMEPAAFQQEKMLAAQFNKLAGDYPGRNAVVRHQKTTDELIELQRRVKDNPYNSQNLIQDVRR